MQITTFATAAAIFAATSLAAPTGKEIDYTPKGGWESIEYPKGTGENLEHYPAPKGGWESVQYPKGTGENLPYYPAPKGGWENVNYPPGTGAGKQDVGNNGGDRPKYFTSSFHVTAIGAEVRNGTISVPGPTDAVGYFKFDINSESDIICYDITLHNVVGEYMSPAKTATHVHQAARGASGPPRLAFPNPVGDDKFRRSSGCLKFPFTTGVAPEGTDTGAGFRLKQIEENPAGFFADSHTKLFSLGVVRGQLA